MARLNTPSYIERYKRFLLRLREARLKAGMTQEQVATSLGRPQSFVSKCESGERRVDFVEAQDFAELYGIALDRLGDV